MNGDHLTRLSSANGYDLAVLAAEIARPLPVPGTSLFSRHDGLVTGTTRRDSTAPPEDNIEVGCPRVLMARDPEVLSIIARRLARRPPTAAVTPG